MRRRRRWLAAPAAVGLVFAPAVLAGGAGAQGGGGGVPGDLTLDQVAAAMAPIFSLLPDADGDGFPDIPRGDDGEADFGALDRLIGEPGVRDLEPDNVEVELPDGTTAIIATPQAAVAALGQIARAGGDSGLVGGSGSQLTGPCYGVAFSYDDDGRPLDMAFDLSEAAPPFSFGENGIEQAFTSDNPFKVHVNGAVIYTGIAGGMAPGSGPREHDWFIRMEFLGFTGSNIDAGGDPNNDGENRNAGSLNFRDDVPGPAKINGLVAISARMVADNGFLCEASGFGEFQGGLDPSLPGVALVFLASVGMLFNARPALTWGGVDT